MGWHMARSVRAGLLAPSNAAIAEETSSCVVRRALVVATSVLGQAAPAARTSRATTSFVLLATGAARTCAWRDERPMRLDVGLLILRIGTDVSMICMPLDSLGSPQLGHVDGEATCPQMSP